MSLRSELVQIQVTNSQGKGTTYYTYDGYYEEQDRHRIRKHRRQIQRRTITSSLITGFLAYYSSRKLSFSQINYKSYRIPTKGLLSGTTAFIGSFLLFDYIGTQQIANFERDIALNSHHLPLWKNKRAAVNPDRAYFQLVDSMDNQISIFHSGLTAESAANIIPDLIIGTVPKKPQISKERH